MIPSVKNRQTMDILKKLREQGAPGRDDGIGTVSLDMTIPGPKKLETELEGEAEMDEAEDGEAPLAAPGLKKKKRQNLP